MGEGARAEEERNERSRWKLEREREREDRQGAAKKLKPTASEGTPAATVDHSLHLARRTNLTSTLIYEEPPIRANCRQSQLICRLRLPVRSILPRSHFLARFPNDDEQIRDLFSETGGSFLDMMVEAAGTVYGMKKIGLIKTTKRLLKIPG